MSDKGFPLPSSIKVIPGTEEAQAAYADAGQHQTSFYGQLAAEKAGLAMDPALTGRESYPDWRGAGFAGSSLIEAARQLLAEKGAAGFTLKDAAKLAGVSPAAPYRHFKDRAALIGAVSDRGFELFSERLKAAAEKGRYPAEAFGRLGEAYLAFGPLAPHNSLVRNLSEAGDLHEAARNLFSMLHELDAMGAQMIAVAPIPETGLGEAINDRLKRAAAPRA